MVVVSSERPLRAMKTLPGSLTQDYRRVLGHRRQSMKRSFYLALCRIRRLVVVGRLLTSCGLAADNPQ